MWGRSGANAVERQRCPFHGKLLPSDKFQFNRLPPAEVCLLSLLAVTVQTSVCSPVTSSQAFRPLTPGRTQMSPPHTVSLCTGPKRAERNVLESRALAASF